MYNIGMNCRTALTAFVYRKSMSLNNSARQKLTTGEIVNLMSNDTQRYVEVTQFLQQIWSGPMVIIVGLILLINLVGVSALVGVGIMIITIPLQAMMFKWAGTLRRQVMQQSDIRIKLTNEILQGIKVIKFYAWENSFVDSVASVRKVEVKAVLKTSILRGVNFGLFMAIPSLISITTFIVYSALGNAISAEIIFPAIAYMNVLRFPLLLLPMIINQLAQVKVSGKRLSALFNAKENTGEDVQWDMPKGTGEGAGSVEVKGGTFFWNTGECSRSAKKLRGGKFNFTGPLAIVSPISADAGSNLDAIANPSKGGKKAKKGKKGRKAKVESDEENKADETGADGEKLPETNLHAPFQLDGINFRAEEGEFIGIVGAVGSGKSSLISAILGDMTKKEVSVAVLLFSDPFCRA